MATTIPKTSFLIRTTTTPSQDNTDSFCEHKVIFLVGIEGATRINTMATGTTTIPTFTKTLTNHSLLSSDKSEDSKNTRRRTNSCILTRDLCPSKNGQLSRTSKRARIVSAVSLDLPRMHLVPLRQTRRHLNITRFNQEPIRITLKILTLTYQIPRSK